MQDKKTLAIIAGKGDLPKMIIRQCQKQKRQFILILVAGQADENIYQDHKYNVVGIGYVSQALDILHKHNVGEIVFAGGIDKPSMSEVKVDGKGAILVSKILGRKLFGDNNVLTTVVDFFEKEGFKIIGVDQIIEDLVAKKGPLGKAIPSEEFLTDIKIGKNALELMSELDIGQSIAIQQNQIIGIEAIEGTDELISRCLSVGFKKGRKAVLVKMKKIGQNEKIDLPSLGVKTIENLHKSNFAGIVVESNAALIIDRNRVVELADKYGLFIFGI